MRGPRENGFEIELELGPEATIAAGTRDAVSEAFSLAELSVEWVPLRGDRSSTAGSTATAEASLHVRLRAFDESSGADMIEAVRAPLATALARVRLALPDLPVGIETVSSEGRRRFFAFARTDTEQEISVGMMALAGAAAHAGDALGWDANEGVWRIL
jgi:hypothetical protein